MRDTFGFVRQAEICRKTKYSFRLPDDVGAQNEILSRAADAARHQAALTPEPSQFIYIKMIGTSAAIGDGDHITMQADLHEEWLSADGTRTSLVRLQPRSPSNLGKPTGPWQKIVEPPCGDTSNPGASCLPQPAYRPGLPTSAGAMLAYLYRTRAGQNPPPAQAFITAGDLIPVSYLRPAALAALFEALKKLPGVSVAHHAVNAAGSEESPYSRPSTESAISSSSTREPMSSSVAAKCQ